MLRVRRAEVLEVKIPFRLRFRHALAERSEGENLLVRLDDGHGAVGWGESAPREYVTGETLESAREALVSELLPPFLGRTYSTFAEAIAALEQPLDKLPRDRHAAFCALELALLDLAGKSFERSAAEAVGPLRAPTVRYGGVVSADGVEKALRTCAQFRELGLESLKIKVGRSPDEDLATVRGVREMVGPACSIRVDANGAWDAAAALQALERLAPFRLDGVEQPVPARDLDGLAWLTPRSPVPVIADESLVSFEDARRLAERGACRILNLRVSKCGGLLNTKRIHALATREGLGSGLGAHVGETAILSAAGRHIATRIEGLRFLEGSYGTLLLEKDVATPDLTIGRGGEAPALDGRGLGIEVDVEALEPFVRARYEVAGH